VYHTDIPKYPHVKSASNSYAHNVHISLYREKDREREGILVCMYYTHTNTCLVHTTYTIYISMCMCTRHVFVCVSHIHTKIRARKERVEFLHTQYTYLCVCVPDTYLCVYNTYIPKYPNVKSASNSYIHNIQFYVYVYQTRICVCITHTYQNTRT